MPSTVHSRPRSGTSIASRFQGIRTLLTDAGHAGRAKGATHPSESTPATPPTLRGNCSDAQRKSATNSRQASRWVRQASAVLAWQRCIGPRLGRRGASQTDCGRALSMPSPGALPRLASSSVTRADTRARSSVVTSAASRPSIASGTISAEARSVNRSASIAAGSAPRARALGRARSRPSRRTCAPPRSSWHPHPRGANHPSRRAGPGLDVADEAGRHGVRHRVDDALQHRVVHDLDGRVAAVEDRAKHERRGATHPSNHRTADGPQGRRRGWLGVLESRPVLKTPWPDSGTTARSPLHLDQTGRMIRFVNSDPRIDRIAENKDWSTGTAYLCLRADFKCEYCGLDFLASPDNYKQIQVDHIVPKSKKGDDDF